MVFSPMGFFCFCFLMNGVLLFLLRNLATLILNQSSSLLELLFFTPRNFLSFLFMDYEFFLFTAVGHARVRRKNVYFSRGLANKFLFKKTKTVVSCFAYEESLVFSAECSTKRELYVRWWHMVDWFHTSPVCRDDAP